MSKANPSDMAASVRQRLLNLSREKGEDFQLVLNWYGLERLLYRLGCSEHGGDFVLKGAMLFPAWSERTYRLTRDLDLLGFGHGDVVHPEAMELKYPTLLKFPPPKVKGYTPESVVAEKFQAMVALGMVNSRMKDFYDIWVIAKQFTFEGSVLVAAIQATFERRQTPIPDSTPRGLSDEFASDLEKATQWKSFLSRTGLQSVTSGLESVVQELRTFLMPLVDAAAKDEAFDSQWKEGGPWS